MTKANEFDKMNELLIERTAKKFERASKNKLKKFLTNKKNCDKIIKLLAHKKRITKRSLTTEQ